MGLVEIVLVDYGRPNKAFLKIKYYIWDYLTFEVDYLVVAYATAVQNVLLHAWVRIVNRIKYLFRSFLCLICMYPNANISNTHYN